VQLSDLVCDVPAIAELDINPLLLGSDGALVLDARIRIAAPASGAPRLAIRPYPCELEEDVILPDGGRLWLRPVRPEDETAMARAFGSLTPEEIYLRFFAPLKSLSHRMGARFTQIDYERQMAFILTEHGPPGETEYLGSVNVVCDADLQHAEFAILVRHEVAGRGLGRRLMEKAIDWARSRGIRDIAGDVLAHNTAMASLCHSLGFRVRSSERDATLLRVVLALDTNGGGEPLSGPESAASS
jgi:acetyltransferase